jgi:hypothetical protein
VSVQSPCVTSRADGAASPGGSRHACDLQLRPRSRDDAPGPVTDSMTAVFGVLVPPAVCRCGHLKPVHMHYRKGTECSCCECPRYQWSVRATIRARRPERES